MLNYPFSYLRGKCNNFIDTINPFNNLVYNKLSSHSIGARSLYLFIVVIYQFKCFFSDPELLHSKSYLSKIKKNILNCGCISIKFTQWIVSKLKGSDDNEKYSDVIEELEVLFDNCKYHDFKHTEDTFTDSLGMDISDIIDMNTLESIASGSIGQVYRAKFKDNCNLGSNNGPNSKFDFKEDIIIKVKHPDLEYIKTYQMILINFLALLQKIPYFKTKLQLHINFSDFIDMVNKQIDFNVEAVNCNKFQEIYKDNEYIVIPRIFKYSSSIIIASYEGGDYFFDISEYQKNKVAINLLALVGDMTLVQNFMHGDMHIKNWKVRKYKDNYQIVLYDFGICFSGPENEYNRQLWKAGEQQNVKKIIELFMSEIAYDNINKDKLKLMKKESIIVNTSRGPIIKEQDLIVALNQGTISCAALDVFDKEPLPTDHVLRKTKNTILTPHIGYVSEESYKKFFNGYTKAIEAFLKCNPINQIS